MIVCFAGVNKRDHGQYQDIYLEFRKGFSYMQFWPIIRTFGFVGIQFGFDFVGVQFGDVYIIS